MKAYGITNQGLVRANNEDSYFVDLDRGLLIVADGMGGHAGGEIASALAIRTVVANLGDVEIQPEGKIEQAVNAANRVIYTESASDESLSGMGTTLTLVLKLPGFLITGHIGDSKAFLINSKDIRCLTSDHSMSGQLLASGKITDAEAMKHPQRHVLTRALGTRATSNVEVIRYPWSTGQYLLLCTDGLTDVVLEDEIFTVVNAPGSIEQKTKELLSLVLDRGAPDNVTIILAEL